MLRIELIERFISAMLQLPTSFDPRAMRTTSPGVSPADSPLIRSSRPEKAVLTSTVAPAADQFFTGTQSIESVHEFGAAECESPIITKRFGSSFCTKETGLVDDPRVEFSEMSAGVDWQPAKLKVAVGGTWDENYGVDGVADRGLFR